MRLDEGAPVVFVAVALRDDLADEDGVGGQGAGARDELLVLDLRAEVVDVEALVALEAFVARVAFVIEDGVDADGMGIAARARPDDDDLSPEHAFDPLLDVVAGHRLGADIGDVERGAVDGDRRAPVDDEEGEAIRAGLHRGDDRIDHAEELDETLRRFTSARPRRQLEHERELHHAVAFSVAVGAQRAARDGACHTILLAPSPRARAAHALSSSSSSGFVYSGRRSTTPE